MASTISYCPTRVPTVSGITRGHILEQAPYSLSPSPARDASVRAGRQRAGTPPCDVGQIPRSLRRRDSKNGPWTFHSLNIRDRRRLRKTVAKAPPIANVQAVEDRKSTRLNSSH